LSVQILVIKVLHAYSTTNVYHSYSPGSDILNAVYSNKK